MNHETMSCIILIPFILSTAHAIAAAATGTDATGTGATGTGTTGRATATTINSG
jgi:hypothetical protein